MDPEIKLGTRWQNKKNGKIYIVLGQVINSTNAQDGQIMVRYNRYDELTPDYVREVGEFKEKFIPL